MSHAGGIAAWLAMGPVLQFGNDWQLDINTAVAVELMLMTTFLQNTKRRHRLYMHACARKLGDLDAELEEELLGEATVNEVTPDSKATYLKKLSPLDSESLLDTDMLCHTAVHEGLEKG